MFDIVDKYYLLSFDISCHERLKFIKFACMQCGQILSTYTVLVKSQNVFVSQFHSDLNLNLITSTATWSREDSILFQCIRHKISKQATFILKKDTVAQAHFSNKIMNKNETFL